LIIHSNFRDKSLKDFCSQNVKCTLYKQKPRVWRENVYSFLTNPEQSKIIFPRVIKYYWILWANNILLKIQDKCLFNEIHHCIVKENIAILNHSIYFFTGFVRRLLFITYFLPVTSHRFTCSSQNKYIVDICRNCGNTQH